MSAKSADLGADCRRRSEDDGRAARHNVANGAQIIDINMGCPAKKVCNVMAGSALLRDEPLVKQILDAVVQAVPDTPVTLKIRTGWDSHNRNALAILKIAEDAGIRALAIHGRTRAQQYTGDAEYDTIRAVKAGSASRSLPMATSIRRKGGTCSTTAAPTVMIGRAAQGRPWLFREIEHYLKTGDHLPPARVSEIHDILRAHLDDLYSFYGIETGVRRKETYCLVPEGPRRFGRLPPCHEPVADAGTAAAGRQ